ncbi:class I SAM-dependent methyltransferase [Pedobacter cryoconitis]|uniref:Methyltransferase family protein n=1 Tax=Pedobacter cryoconitis TaxID=188932 RepID=A0A327SC33_9SPHI|nr:class I SAM-dependent methyltransferase [Pedobacter cryoconitis]RAJ26348.1 methyltransferase family protein [Pedobacter cryoconitis]
MKNKLYKEFASYYAAVTNDRDFKSQLDLMLSAFDTDSPCKSILELFAGQSLHSIAAQKKPDIDVWAIDSSSEMKQLALAEGFHNPAQYIVADLPEAMLKIENVKFDCITCLYHGLSNLNNTEVHQLFTYCKQQLSSEGKMFIELHNITYIMEYISNPQVVYTEVTNEKGELIKYAWPSGKIQWDPYTYIAQVPVQFLIGSSHRTDTIEFTSSDRIYSTEDIVFFANLAGFDCRIMTTEPHWAKHFEHGIILELSQKPTVPNL